MNIKQYLSQLKISGKERNIPNISNSTANFILTLLEKFSVKNMLEIGCANGYSSLYWANFLNTSINNGKLHIIDVSQPIFHEAFEHLYNCKLHLNVIGYLGNALEILPNFQHKIFDCIFIDAQKKYTADFVKLSLPLLQENGLLIIDDVIKFKYKMRGLFEYLDNLNIQYNIEKTDIDDGILWAIIK